MTPQLANEIDQGSAAPRPLWRRAMAGMTPKVIVIIFGLLIARVLSQNTWIDVDAGGGAQLVAWIGNLGDGLLPLVMMVVPIVIVVIATANFGPQQGVARGVALGTAILLSCFAGTVLRMFYMGQGTWFDGATRAFFFLWPRYTILAGMLTIVGEFYRRELASVTATQNAELDRSSFEREMTEARLQVLQAQIEPHFLFNTLANVRRLYDQDHAAGRTMLDNLIRYFELALPHMRLDESTLDRDAELVEAFLHIQRIRMGRRLVFGVDIPQELRTHRVPPMMLLTLVENAIKHGINPSADGGQINVTARADGGQLNLCVADTGVGFVPGQGGGTGLANINARLAAQFGTRASLALENNERGGATATIVLPLASVA